MKTSSAFLFMTYMLSGFMWFANLMGLLAAIVSSVIMLFSGMPFHWLPPVLVPVLFLMSIALTKATYFLLEKSTG